MIAKYAMISCYDKPELLKGFEKCHCPMDSVMIGKVLKKVKKGEIKKLNNQTRWSIYNNLSSEKINAYEYVKEKCAFWNYN